MLPKLKSAIYDSFKILLYIYMSTERKTYKGFFHPKNKNKYYGDVNNIVYRSSWELRVMKYLDENPNVVTWASEEIFVHYFNPIDLKEHRYFPDFLVRIKQKDGKLKTLMLEVKPEYQTQQPKQKRKTKRYLEESATYVINQAKWKAADIFCQQQGWEFKILTERDLGL